MRINRRKSGKLAIFIMSYKAAGTIVDTIERISPSAFRKCAEIYVIDDASPDGTFEVASAYKRRKKMRKLRVFRNSKNLGYGGNSKKGLSYAIKKGYDIVVVLHGDGQYPPEKINELIKPIEEGRADLVLGSRMLQDPLKQGMPLWKYFGNKLLTHVINKTLGLNLSECQCGFKAFATSALGNIPLDSMANDYNFTAQTIFHFSEKGMRIAEIPIPIYYAKGSTIFYEIKKSFVTGAQLLKVALAFKLCRKV